MYFYTFTRVAQERFEAIRTQLGPYLKQCGYKDSAIQWLPAVRAVIMHVCIWMCRNSLDQQCGL